MAVLALTLPLARRSAIHVPRRDLVMGAGDDLTLRVSLVERDHPDAAPVNLRLTLARLRLRAWREVGPHGGNDDYASGWRGPLLTTASAVATEERPNSIDLRVHASDTRLWYGGGRLGWSLQGNVSGDDVALCWGALHMRPGLGLPALGIATDEDVLIGTDEGEGVAA